MNNVAHVHIATLMICKIVIANINNFISLQFYSFLVSGYNRFKKNMLGINDVRVKFLTVPGVHVC